MNQKYKIKKLHRFLSAGSTKLKTTSQKITRYDAQRISNESKQKYWDKLNKIQTKRGKRMLSDKDMPYMGNIYKAEFDAETNISEVCAHYQNDPNIEFAQPNYMVTVYSVPDDPFYSSSGSWEQGYDDLWGLKKIQMTQGWDLALGEDVIVAVVDTGLDDSHPDIIGNVWANEGEIPANSLDDDGNGFVDDTWGWDFANNDNDPVDGHGHGTHVSGTIAAVGNNSIGIIGVAPQAQIMPVKGLSDSGSGSSFGLAQAMQYAAENGAAVINNSWGCSGACPTNPVIEDAVRLANGLGTIVVFSAGNDNIDVNSQSPQNMPETITVGASDHLNQRATFSNFGNLLDVVAPGGDSNGAFEPSNILSLQAEGTALGPEVIPEYIRLRGTSMSAPHVSGLAALLWSSSADMNVFQLKKQLYGNVLDLGIQGFDSYYGFGLIQASDALSDASEYILSRIKYPRGEFLFGQNLEIKGIAAASSFSDYELLVGEGMNPTSWEGTGIVLTGGEVMDDVLATWNTMGFADGIWTIRLIVYNAAQEIKESRVHVNIDNSLQFGWPKSTMFGKGSYHNTLVLADLDGDNTHEVIAGSAEGLLYAWHYDGTSVDGFPVAASSYQGETLTPAVGNLDDDPQLEIVAVSNGWHPNGEYPDIFVFNHDGTNVPGWPKISSNYISDPPTLADIDGDGDLEILIGQEDWHVHAYHHTGESVAGWPVHVDHGQNVSGITIADIDHDNDVEIFAANNNFLYAWHHMDSDNDGKADPVNGWPVAVPQPIPGYNEVIYIAPAIGDVDGDGDMEIVATSGAATSTHQNYQVYVWEATGEVAAGWPRYVEDTIQWASIALADLNNDGIVDIIGGGQDGHIWAWNGADGVALPGFPVALGGNLSRGLSPVVGDVDGDEFPEIVVGGGGGMFVIEHDGGIKTGWPKLVDVEVAPAIADLDNDGDVEVLAYANYPDVNIYAWDLSDEQTPVSRKMAWPLLGRNAQHTGSVNQLPVAEAGPNQSMRVGEDATFYGLDSFDSDGQIVSYEWDFGDGESASGAIQTHVYSLEGSFVVTLTVTDNDGAVDQDVCLASVSQTGEVCGNGYCAGAANGEDCSSCPEDCIGGSGGSCSACWKGSCDASCHPRKETSACADCAPSYCCGDAICSYGEDAISCLVDCGCTSDDDCSDGESCTTDVCNEGICENIWPSCGTADGCCAESCSASDDPDCQQPPDCSPCFKGRCDGSCNPIKDGPMCPDCQ